MSVQRPHTTRILAIAMLAAMLGCGPGRAAAAPANRTDNPLVVELFTSQSCSSCPPADALLAELSRTHAEILVLDFHVTYWDRLGWKDPFSLPGATERQRRYARQLRQDNIYTPQLVAGGQHQAIGSDRAAVLAAIAAASGAQPAARPRLVRAGAGLLVEVGSGRGTGTALLIGFDANHTTSIAGGENGGRTLTEVNVVRSITPIGPWSGEPLSLSVGIPAGERTAVLLQGEDGRILGAAVLPLN